MKKRIIIAIGVIALGIIILLITGKTVQRDGLTEYVESVMNIQLSDLVSSEEGKIEESPREDYATIKLKIVDGGLELIKARTERTPRAPIGESYHGINSEDIDSIYDYFTEGKAGAKTRSMEVLLVRTDEGEYLYFFG